MKLTKAVEQATRKGVGASFTGIAWQQPIAVSETPEPLHVTRVTFEPGARTVWHHHPAGQVLIATVGIGRFQVEGGAVRALYPGDSVTFAPGEVHWHGAAPDQLFAHVSIQAEDAGGEQATWLHPVSDEDYARDPD